MKCTLCRAAAAEHPGTTCAKCSAELPDQLLLASLSANAFRVIGVDDLDRQQRKAALSVRCPFCKAGPGSDCTKPSRGGAVRTRMIHPSRIEAAAGPKAA